MITNTIVPYNVRIKYKEAFDRKNDEREILNNLRESYHLLNDLSGFDYSIANELDEKLKIQEFVNKKILNNKNT